MVALPSRCLLAHKAVVVTRISRSATTLSHISFQQKRLRVASSCYNLQTIQTFTTAPPPTGTSFAITTTATNRYFSSELSSGTDLLADSLGFSAKPKIIFDAHAPTGIDVVNVLPPENFSAFTHQNDEDEDTAGDDDGENNKMTTRILHMNGSCLAFPHSCYLWKPRCAKEVTLESLEIVLHLEPKVELLFIGCDEMLAPRQMNIIRKEFKQRKGIIVEQLSLTNAMATFNILNGEERPIAAAIVLPDDKVEDEL